MINSIDIETMHLTPIFFQPHTGVARIYLIAYYLLKFILINTLTSVLYTYVEIDLIIVNIVPLIYLNCWVQYSKCGIQYKPYTVKF